MGTSWDGQAWKVRLPNSSLAPGRLFLTPASCETVGAAGGECAAHLWGERRGLTPDALGLSTGPDEASPTDEEGRSRTPNRGSHGPIDDHLAVSLLAVVSDKRAGPL